VPLRFQKYHALGNDYLVLDPVEGDVPAAGLVETICHRNYGLGGDGILFGPLPSESADFGLRIFNPDGGEAEKSGNGLRIFCRFLHDRGEVGGDAFSIETAGGVVTARVDDPADRIEVGMGRVSFDSRDIPVEGDPREVLRERIEVGGEKVEFSAATIGNPHCVVLRDEATEAEARRLGPLLERDPRFPNRTNVQFLRIVDRKTIRIEIWERGAGYTLASGSSASASAAVARRLDLVDEDVAVVMPGGTLAIRVADDFAVRMTGPVTRVGELAWDP
jgi:diaminopimelate epimerase